MDIFVKNFLTSKKNYLEERLQEASRNICVLKCFQWRNNLTPNYEYELHRYLYYLKFSYAYIFDYYLIYKFIMENDLQNYEKISIVSIGCGGMLDRIGLNYAKNEFNIGKISYFGIDKVDWKNKEIIDHDNGIFINSSIGNVKRNRFTSKIGLIIFPRSLSEIPCDSLSKFIKRLHRDNFSDNLYIIAMPASNDLCNKENEILLHFIKTVQNKAKFTLSEQIKNTILDGENRFYDQYYINDFSYPPDIYSWIIKMDQYCLEPCPDKDEECKYIWKKPITGLPSFEPLIYILSR